MNCFPELTYSIYADDELPLQEARLVEAHLFVCPECRRLVEALQAENRMLSAAVRELGEAPATSPRLGRSLMWTTLSAVAVAVVLDTVGSWLSDLVPSLAGWVSPLNRTTLMNLLFSGSLYVADQGASVLQSLVTMLTVVLLAIAAGGALYFFFRRRPNSISMAMLAGVTLMIGVANPASAIERRKGPVVNVAAGETVEGTLLASGSDVAIDGTVNGDLLVFAKTLTIHGTVKGDILTFAQSVDLDGDVTGNIYAVAQTLYVRGTVEHNLYGWIQTIEVDSKGRVQGDMVAGSAVNNLNGEIGRDATLFCGNAQVRGRVGRHLEAFAGQMTVTPAAKIGGNLTVYTHHRDDVHIEQGATISGNTRIELRKQEPSRYSRRHFYLWEAAGLVGAFLVGLLLNWIFPRALATRLNTAGSALSTIGIGFLLLVATPIAAIVVCITLIGLPLGLITLFCWLLALYLAKIFVAALIGQGLTRNSRPGNPASSFAWALLVGLFIVFVAINLPFVGGWIRFLVLLLGLGLLWNILRQTWKQRTASVL